MGQYPSHITSSESPYDNPFEDEAARAIQTLLELLNNESTDPLLQLIENQVSENFTEEIPVLMPPRKLMSEEIWGGSNIYDEATAYRSWHYGECSQDGGGSDDDHDSAIMHMIMNTTPAQYENFLWCKYILDDVYIWKKYGQMGEKRIGSYYLTQHYAQKALKAVKNNKNWRQELKELYEKSDDIFLGAQLDYEATAFRSRQHSGWSSQDSGGQVHIIQVDHHFSRSTQLASPPALTDHQIVMASALSDGSAPSQVQNTNEEPPFDILKLAKIFLLISAEEGLALLAIWFSVGTSLSASARILLRGAGICSAIGFHSSLGSYILQCVRRAEPAARLLMALGGLAAVSGFTSVSCLFLPENLMLSFAGVVGILNIFILSFLFIKKH